MSKINTVNNGAELVQTDYWESEAAQRGKAFISIIGTTWRFLVPKAIEAHLPDMIAANEIKLTVGLKGAELVFDDGSDDPLMLQWNLAMLKSQVEGLVRPPNDATTSRFVVYSETKGKVKERDKFTVYSYLRAATWTENIRRLLDDHFGKQLDQKRSRSKNGLPKM